MTRKYTYSILVIILVFTACNKSEVDKVYEKETIFGGYNVPMEKLTIETYTGSDWENINKNQPILPRKIYTTYYDMNGHKSMNELTEFMPDNRKIETLEQFSRDKNAYMFGIDASVKIDSAKTIVNISRLKTRKNKEEHWLTRQYLQPEKYIEGAYIIAYTDSSKSTYKLHNNEKIKVEEEIYDSNNQLKQANKFGELNLNTTFYYNKNLIDSIQYTYTDPLTDSIKQRYTEVYKYKTKEINGKIFPELAYIYRGDSLTYASVYKPILRKE